MIRIMLVDDEPFTRVAIKTLFSWEEHGFQIVSEASNGEAALLKLAYEPVDLIITDIKMPITDGISLIHQVKQKYPHILCVVLSNYGDFTLTRNAFREGAVDYLLKGNLNAESFSALVKRLKGSYLSDTPSAAPAEVSDETPTPEIHIWLLQQLVSEHDVSSELISQFHPELPYVISSIKLGDSHPQAERPAKSSANENLIKNTVLRIISEISEFKLYYHAVSTKEYILLIYNKENSEELFFQKLKAFFSALTSNIQMYLNNFTVVGSSGLHTEAQEIAEAFTCACAQSDNIFYCHSSAQFFSQESNTNTKEVKNFVRSNLNTLTPLLQEQNWEGLRQFFTDLLSLIRETLYPPAEAKRLINNLEFLISNEMTRIFKEDFDFLFDDALHNQIISSENIDFLKEAVGQYLTNFRNVSGHTVVQSEQYSLIVNKAISNLHENYRDPGTNLESVANDIAVNPSYLSRIFHKETGQHFSTYLTSLRMNYAKIQLSSTKESISVIAEKCGYNSSKYFINIFKKTEGLTPSAYRNEGAGSAGIKNET